LKRLTGANVACRGRAWGGDEEGNKKMRCGKKKGRCKGGLLAKGGAGERVTD